MTQTKTAPNKQLKIITNEAILTLLSLISLILSVWGILIYRMTIVSNKYLFAGVAFGTIIAFSIILMFVKNGYTIFQNLIGSVVLGGGLSYFTMLYFNQRFANSEVFNEEFEIITKGTLGRSKSGCSQPYAIVDFHGTEKQLVFYCDYAQTLKECSKVVVSYSKGLFGFDIIRNKQLAP